MKAKITTLDSSEINVAAMKLIEVIENQGSACLSTSYDPERLMKIVSQISPASLRWNHLEKNADTYLIYVERKGACCGACQGH